VIGRCCAHPGCWKDVPVEETYCVIHETRAYAILRQLKTYNLVTRGAPYMTYECLQQEDEGDWLKYEDVEKLLNASIS
jgi:hypothetical protein